MNENQKLIEANAERVTTVENQASYFFDERPGGPAIQVHGKLEIIPEPDEDEYRYYLRINETYDGPSGIQFNPDDVALAEVTPGGRLRIVLR